MDDYNKNIYYSKIINKTQTIWVNKTKNEVLDNKIIPVILLDYYLNKGYVEGAAVSAD